MWYVCDDFNGLIKIKSHFNCLVQDCGNSIASALELLQSCTKQSICFLINANVTSKYLAVYRCQINGIFCVKVLPWDPQYPTGFTPLKISPIGKMPNTSLGSVLKYSQQARHCASTTVWVFLWIQNKVCISVLKNYKYICIVFSVLKTVIRSETTKLFWYPSYNRIEKERSLRLRQCNKA